MLLIFWSVSCNDDDDDDSSPYDDDDDDDDDDDNDDNDDDDFYAPPPSNDVGIFVATTGNDDNPGTMEAPLRTVTKAAEVAENEGKSVFVAGGEYQHDELTTRVSLFGGYDGVTWARDLSAYPTTLIGTGWATLVIEPSGRKTEIIMEGFVVQHAGLFTDGAAGVYVRGPSTFVNNIFRMAGGYDGHVIGQSNGEELVVLYNDFAEFGDTIGFTGWSGWAVHDLDTLNDC